MADRPAEVFVAPVQRKSTRVYDALAEGPSLLLAATRVNADKLDEVLAFVRAWGLLGAARPFAIEEGRLAADSVAATAARCARSAVSLAGSPRCTRDDGVTPRWSQSMRVMGVRRPPRADR